MQEEKPALLKSSTRTLQDYLSIGYLFLLVLGILRDSIYYSFVDLNFLRYSNILDVLLSPVSYMSENYKVPLVLVGIILLFSLLGKARLHFHNKYKQKAWYQKRFKVEKLDAKYNKPATIDSILIILALFIMSFYIGTGIGGGIKLSSILEEKNAKANQKIYFIAGDTLEAKVIGQNSQYLFYIPENGDRVVVVPIQGNVMKMERLPKKKE